MRFLTMIVMALLASLAQAADQGQRIKDLATVQGVRPNQLVGYGLVVGLDGTGEKNNAFSEQTFRTMLNNFGIKVPDTLKPKIKDVVRVTRRPRRPIRRSAFRHCWIAWVYKCLPACRFNPRMWPRLP